MPRFYSSRREEAGSGAAGIGYQGLSAESEWTRPGSNPGESDGVALG
jgi:hypothetical protein